MLTRAEYSDMHFIGWFSGVQVLGLLWWITSCNIHFTEIKISKHLRTYMELVERLVHSPA